MLDTLPRGSAPANDAPRKSPSDDSEMFELAPVSLWLEDFSGVRALFDAWRAEGVTDLRAHFAEHPSRVAECAHSIRVIKVNRKTLTHVRGRRFRHAHRQSRLRVSRRHAEDPPRRAVPVVGRRRRSFTSQTVNYTLGGRRLDVLLKGAVLPGHEARWDRVLVSRRRHHRTRRRAASRDACRTVCARPVRVFAGVALGRGFQRGQASARRSPRGRHQPISGCSPTCIRSLSSAACRKSTCST